MKIIPWIIALVAVLVAVYFWNLSRDQDQTAQRLDAEQEIKLREADARIAKRSEAVARLQSEMDSAAQVHMKNQASLNRSLNASKRRERLLRPDSTLFTIVDTVYMAYDSLIEDLTLERDGIRRDCKTLVDSLLANAMDFRGIIDIKDDQNAALGKQILKERKRGKIFKWLFYAAAGWAVIENLRE